MVSVETLARILAVDCGLGPEEGAVRLRDGLADLGADPAVRSLTLPQALALVADVERSLAA